MAMNEQEVLQEAERRYHMDAEFQAEVERAIHVPLNERTAILRRHAFEDEMAYARISVAVALVLRDST